MTRIKIIEGGCGILYRTRFRKHSSERTRKPAATSQLGNFVRGGKYGGKTHIVKNYVLAGRRSYRALHLPAQDIEARTLYNRHVEDYQAALDFVRGPALADIIDGSRVALWGTSFAGGHVLQTAAADKVPPEVGMIRAVISQV